MSDAPDLARLEPLLDGLAVHPTIDLRDRRVLLKVALHESAHAAASLALFGPDDLIGLRLALVEPEPGRFDLVGGALRRGPALDSSAAMRGELLVSLAGEAAEQLWIGGVRNAGSDGVANGLLGDRAAARSVALLMVASELPEFRMPAGDWTIGDAELADALLDACGAAAARVCSQAERLERAHQIETLAFVTAQRGWIEQVASRLVRESELSVEQLPPLTDASAAPFAA